MRKLICLLTCLLFLLTPLQAAATEAAECRHTFSAWEDKGDTHSATCTLCGAVVEAQHEYDEYWTVDADGHLHCCIYCSHSSEAEAHSWPEAWESDGSGHFRLCTVCQTGGQSRAHSLTEPKVVRHALFFRNGRQEQTCTICGYLHAEKLPAHRTLGIVVLSLVGIGILAAATLLILKQLKKRKQSKVDPAPEETNDPT